MFGSPKMCWFNIVILSSTLREEAPLSLIRSAPQTKLKIKQVDNGTNIIHIVNKEIFCKLLYDKFVVGRLFNMDKWGFLYEMYSLI